MRLVLIVVGILLSIGFASCSKWDGASVADGDVETLDQLKVEQDFNWETSTTVEFILSNVPFGLIQITSTDGSIIYHKGNNLIAGIEYSIRVTLPKYATKININDIEVAVYGNQVTYKFVSGKEFMVEDYSLIFNGTSDYVEIDDNELIDDYPFTLAAWVKTSGFGIAGEDMVILNLADPSKSNNYYGIYIGADENGVACLRARKGSAKTIEGSTILTDDQWHFVVGVFSSKNVRKLYVDGVLEGSDNRNVNFDDDAEETVIGRWGDSSPSSYFSGNIDDVQVWEKSLSQTEVNYYFNNFPLGSENDLIGFWNFNTGSGNSIDDQTNNNNDGTIHGAIWANDAGGSNDTDGDGVLNDADDYPNDPDRAFNNYMPASGFGSLAFEDLWPGRGDYDFNDVVVDYRFKTVSNTSNYVLEIEAEFVARASGASQQNGFGFQLANDNIDAGDINVSGMSLNVGYIQTKSNGTEQGQARNTIIVFDNFFNVTPNSVGESGTNTDPTGVYVVPDTVSIEMNFEANTYTQNDIDLSNFNPFIIVNMVRGTEIHLADYPPTTLADVSLFGVYHDDSDPDAGRYYKTENNLPWAINIYESFDYPREKAEITQAYLKFATWASSSGASFSDWYRLNSGYRNSIYVY
jgi:LruC domain-containing protein